jgi:hypothetical protein
MGFEPTTLGVVDNQLGLKVTQTHCNLVVVLTHGSSLELGYLY